MIVHTSTYDSAYEFGRAIVYGDVTNINVPVRVNVYGNIENVLKYDLIQEARLRIEELADWLEDNYKDIAGYDFSECFEDDEDEEEDKND